jgi:RimJ/RimL family protein N-acetyltransferase
MQAPTPITLSGEMVTLVPLAKEHAASYFIIGQEVAIWDYLAPDPFRTVADAERWIDTMFARHHRAGAVTFSVYDNVSRQLAGSTSFLDIRTRDAGLKIGSTWYGKAFWRTHVNTATKLLLLTHAFNELGAVRVQLKTDARNTRSQRAIERLGAVKEGVLRCHMIYPNGFVRDSVMYSITRDEWSAVRARLETMLNAYRHDTPRPE